ncbi:hypothetical protein G4V62_09340 [Bacillaceae bacterium SIJ1]|uniref:hypothetical protein n=1 Tax=Litoribacterium kuwaitense TaxID=1398745 RepID=UPI0013ECFFC4|nr:hypothetical protein [Litoribacterium kuwaitense]NGP45149.1 hypothetical protein [Litoribacterium kuwaitense]
MIIVIVTLFNFNHFSQQNDYKNQVFLDAASRATDAKISSVARYASAISKQSSVQDYISNINNSLFYFPDIYDDLVNSLYLTDDLNINVGITKVTDNYVVSEEGYFALPDYFNHIGISEDVIPVSRFFEEDKHNSFYLLEDDFSHNQNYTMFISKTYYHKVDKYLYIFISIPNEKLFPQELANIDGTFYLETYTPSIAETSGIKKVTQSESFENITIKNTHDNKTLYHIPSSVVNLQYSYLIEDTKFIQFGPTFLPIFLFIAFCLFLLGGMILYFATKKSYNPIQDILNALNKSMPLAFTNTPKANHFSELDFIIENIDGIQHQKKALEDRFNQSLSVLRHEFISSVLYGTINKDEIAHKLTELRMESFTQGGLIAIVSIENPDKVAENISNNVSLRNQTMDLIRTFNDELTFIQIPIDYKGICIIFPSKEGNKINDLLKQMTSFIQSELSIELNFSLSDPVESIYNFNTAFIDVIELTLKKYTYVNSLETFPARELLINDDSYSYSLDDERFLINAVISNDIELAKNRSSMF